MGKKLFSIFFCGHILVNAVKYPLDYMNYNYSALIALLDSSKILIPEDEYRAARNFVISIEELSKKQESDYASLANKLDVLQARDDMLMVNIESERDRYNSEINRLNKDIDRLKIKNMQLKKGEPFIPNKAIRWITLGLVIVGFCFVLDLYYTCYGGCNKMRNSNVIKKDLTKSNDVLIKTTR